MKNQDADDNAAQGKTLRWTLGARTDHGDIEGAKRSSGTVQKDWAIVKSNELPENFCIAVMGHEGWSKDPDSEARYALAVSFEIVGREIAIYDGLRVAIEELQAELEAESIVELEIAEEQAMERQSPEPLPLSVLCAIDRSSLLPHEGWLAPVPLDAPRQKVRQKKTGRRADNKGCLSMGLADYLELLDGTGRQIKSGKRGRIPPHLGTIPDRLQISRVLWVDCVQHFHKWFRSTVVRPRHMESAAAEQNQNRALSIRNSRKVFA